VRSWATCCASKVAACDTILGFETEVACGEISDDAVAEGEERGGMGRSGREFVGCSLVKVGTRKDAVSDTGGKMLAVDEMAKVLVILSITPAGVKSTEVVKEFLGETG